MCISASFTGCLFSFTHVFARISSVISDFRSRASASTHVQAPAPAHFLGYMQPTPALPAQPQWTMSQPIPPPMAVPGGYAPHAPPTATWQQPSGRVEAAELSWNSIWPSPVQPAGNKGGEGSQLPRAPASGTRQARWAPIGQATLSCVPIGRGMRREDHLCFTLTWPSPARVRWL